MARRDSVEEGIQERGPLGDDASLFLLAHWILVCEWATPDGAQSTRWYDLDGPVAQSTAMNVGLATLGEDLAAGRG